MARKQKSSSQSWLPAILIAVGAILLFGNLQLFSFGWVFEMVLNFWPLIVVAMGVSRIVSGKSKDFAGGLQLIAVGVFLQILVFGWLPGNLLSYWPYAMVILGLWLIFIQPKKKRLERTRTDDRLQVSEILHDAHYTVESDSFEGGRLTAVLAHLDCDLTRCDASPVTMKLHAAIYGSAVTLFIPESWHVTLQMSSSMGEARDRRVLGNPPGVQHTEKLIISGSILAGKLELRDVEELQGENAAGKDEEESGNGENSKSEQEGA
ncbi:hypothetical protein KQI65_02785 [bacterium]|nr:hypothetical protein [bacterium]